MHDIRIAFRTLLSRPAFTTVAILTLALGIGANTAVFTVVNSVMLAPLPYHEPSQIVVLNEVSPQFPNPISVSYQNYVDWRDRSRSFDAMAALRTTQMTLVADGEPERLLTRQVTATLLPMLGVQLARGRQFSAADDRPGAAGVVILSHGLWTRRFGASDAVIGQSLQLDKQPFTVIGVLPASFELLQPAEMYVPMGPWAATLPDDRGWHPGILPLARVKRGVSLEQARSEMDGIARQLEKEYPQFNRGVGARVTRLQDQLVQNVRPALLMLLGAVVLVLLIACANVANLLLARAVDRQKEIAVRTALGAGRGRILRQLTTESVVLAMLGGIAGMLVATWGISLLSQTATGLPRAGTIAIDRGVLAFTLLVSIATGLVFGLVPAINVTRGNIRDALNEEGRGTGSGGVRHHRMRAALVVAEVALAFVLLVGAGLLLRSFAALQRVETGFNEAGLLVVDVPLSPVTYREDVARNGVVDRVLERVRALPGVTAAAVTTGLPMTGGGATIHFNIAGRPPKGPEDYRFAGYRAVSAGYFETMGIPLRRGRVLQDSDRQGAPLVAVINESMARQHFGEVDPIGQRFAVGTESDAQTPFFEIVGVAGDVAQSFEAGAKAEYYLPYVQYPDPVLAGLYRSISLVVRTAGEPTAVAPSVRAAMREIDRDQPLVAMRTMEQAIATSVAQPRLRTVLLALFAAVAVVLAIVGVYGVMAYTVSQRAQEIGVRVALGASRQDVVRLVVGQGARLTLLGIGVGIGAALLATRALDGLLFNLDARDPLTFAGAVVVLAAAALLACYLPARRASVVSPIIALQR